MVRLAFHIVQLAYFLLVLLAIATLRITRPKPHLALAVAGPSGALSAVWILFVEVKVIATEGTDVLATLTTFGPFILLLGAVMAMASTAALMGPAKNTARLGALAGVLATPLGLMGRSSLYFEPIQAPLIDLPTWIVVGTVLFWAAIGTIAGGLIGILRSDKRPEWIILVAIYYILAADIHNAHAVRDHVTPIKTLVACRDVPGLRAKADELLSDRSSVWQRYGAQQDGDYEFTLPARAYARVAPEEALHHPVPEVRAAAKRVLAERRKR